MPIAPFPPREKLPKQNALIVWWVLWASFQVGIFVIYFVLTQSNSRSNDSPDNPVWLAAFAPLALSAIIRWMALPRQRSAQNAFTLFIVGIALAETVCILGLFAFPTHHQELFIASVLGIFQFIPVFARRLIAMDRVDAAN